MLVLGRGANFKYSPLNRSEFIAGYMSRNTVRTYNKIFGQVGHPGLINLVFRIVLLTASNAAPADQPVRLFIYE